MVAVAERAVARDAFLRAVTLHTRRLCGHDDVRRVRAPRGMVTFHARYARVLRVIETGAHHPAIRHGRLRDHWSRGAVEFHFVTGRAAVELRPAIRTLAQIGEENFTFEIRPVHELFAQTKHLLGHKFIHVRGSFVGVSARQFCVVRRQAAQKRAHVFGAAMG